MKITPKILFGSALVSLLVLAADIPDALPAGFLEQLPVIMEMDTAEYEAFLVFSEQEMAAARDNKEEVSDEQ